MFDIKMEETKLKLKLTEDRLEMQKSSYDFCKKSSYTLLFIGLAMLLFLMVINYNYINSITVVSLSLLTYTTFKQFQEIMVVLPAKKREMEVTKMDIKYLKLFIDNQKKINEFVIEKDKTPE